LIKRIAPIGQHQTDRFTGFGGRLIGLDGNHGAKQDQTGCNQERAHVMMAPDPFPEHADAPRLQITILRVQYSSWHRLLSSKPSRFGAIERPISH
jgi:hypothetical protein